MGVVLRCECTCTGSRAAGCPAEEICAAECLLRGALLREAQLRETILRLGLLCEPMLRVAVLRRGLLREAVLLGALLREAGGGSGQSELSGRVGRCPETRGRSRHVKTLTWTLGVVGCEVRRRGRGRRAGWNLEWRTRIRRI